MSTTRWELPWAKLVSLFTYLVIGVVAYRALVTGTSPEPVTSAMRGVIGSLLLACVLLTITEPVISARVRWYLHLDCALQTALTVYLIQFVPFYDFFAIARCSFL